MRDQKILRDYMLEGGAKGKAFADRNGHMYIVKDFRLNGGMGLIEADLITQGDLRRKRAGLSLSGPFSHLYDEQVTYSQVRAKLKQNLSTLAS